MKYLLVIVWFIYFAFICIRYFFWDIQPENMNCLLSVTLLLLIILEDNLNKNK